MANPLKHLKFLGTWGSSVLGLADIDKSLRNDNLSTGQKIGKSGIIVGGAVASGVSGSLITSGATIGGTALFPGIGSVVGFVGGLEDSDYVGYQISRYQTSLYKKWDFLVK
ncbi:hypothetical protein LCL89_03820 [Halobacillus yeomjeoni]|uniref:hypothetical protein n=1 Tax=Halobacillus yeomjeoni TaxID=311194 RepID=UPI001CD45C75|nr:hypothetical protein [Halobacillus yeomjeoni]MCA0983174.1 hypothetical protein [Halobacillus yeomjeoni]